ncbi:MAG: hypothetical protein RR413_09195 [Christensenellaceae bacterium]
MSIIPHCYSGENESYITVPALKSFLKEVAPDEKLPSIRQDLVEMVEDYGIISDENCERVHQWLDSVLREGITELHIQSLDCDMLTNAGLLDGEIERRISILIEQLKESHICRRSYTGEFELVACANNKDGEKVLSFCFSKIVYALSCNKTAYTLIYPVFLDLYVNSHRLIARAKPKSTMYRYEGTNFSLEESSPTNIDREIEKAIDALKLHTGISFSVSKNDSSYKSQLYSLLMKYTFTPPEIQHFVNQSKEKIINVSSVIKNEICNLPDQYDADMLWDINNLAEKYFSISYRDKSVFTKGREAYPLKLQATDEEESKVEQTSGFEEPLQSKAIFFDNKKMLQKSGICDGIIFCYIRRNSQYYGPNFKVAMLVKPRYFMVKFPGFTVEEDIQHVLSAFYSAQE